MGIDKVVICLVAGLSLAGCAVMASQDHAKALAACNARSASGEFKTFTARAECRNDADRRIAAPHMARDLLDLRIAARTAVAEKQDRNEITQAQADLELAQMFSQIATEDERRDNARAAARPSITCNTFGNTTSCY